MNKVADSSGSKYSAIMSKFETSPQSKRGPPISPSVVYPFSLLIPYLPLSLRDCPSYSLLRQQKFQFLSICLGTYCRARHSDEVQPTPQATKNQNPKKTTTAGAMPLKPHPTPPPSWYLPPRPSPFSPTTDVNNRNPPTNPSKSTWPP
jgi:hypothetical protein